MHNYKGKYRMHALRLQAFVNKDIPISEKNENQLRTSTYYYADNRDINTMPNKVLRLT